MKKIFKIPFVTRQTNSDDLKTFFLSADLDTKREISKFPSSHSPSLRLKYC